MDRLVIFNKEIKEYLNSLDPQPIDKKAAFSDLKKLIVKISTHIARKEVQYVR